MQKLPKPTFQFLLPNSIKRGYTEFECPSLALLNNGTIYNQSQGPNQTGNISLTLDSKRRLVVLAFRVLLTRNGAHAKNGIRNKILKLINWVINWNFLIHEGAWKKIGNGAHAKYGIRNKKLNSSTRSLVGIFKYAKVSR